MKEVEIVPERISAVHGHSARAARIMPQRRHAVDVYLAGTGDCAADDVAGAVQGAAQGDIHEARTTVADREQPLTVPNGTGIHHVDGPGSDAAKEAAGADHGRGA